MRHIAHRVAVMRQREVVEEADTATLFACPQHEYTQTLLDAIPRPQTPRHCRNLSPAEAGLATQ